MPSIRTIAHRATSIVVSVLVVGCGSANTTNETPYADSGAGAPVVVSAIDKAYFQSVPDMAAAAELIVVGQVTKVSLASSPVGAAEGEDSFPQMALNTVAVTKVIKGPSVDEIVVGQYSFEWVAGELRDVALDGLLPSREGDTVLLFLVAAPESEWEWEAVSLDGMLWLKGDSIISTILPGRFASSLNGRPLDTVLAEVAKAD